MDFKKKLGIGVLTGALGLSLIGGGTWAAFNDVEEVDHSFAAGTLDLVIGEGTTIDFDIRNLKPGDYFTKELVLENNGSLDINQILTDISVDEDSWNDLDVLNLHDEVGTDEGDNSLEEFLSQFHVSIERDGDGVVFDDTLDKLNGHSDDITGTDDETAALAPGDDSTFTVTVTFVEDPTRFSGSRYFVQNKYQGEGATVEMKFEATQMPGEDRSND